MITNRHISKPSFPHLDAMIREIKEEQAYINGTVIPYMREHGYTPQSGAMNWSSVKLAANNPSLFPNMEHRTLKFEEFFTFKGYAVSFEEEKFMKYYDSTQKGRERISTLRRSNHCSTSGRNAIQEEVL